MSGTESVVVEGLQQHIAALVCERQQMRISGASPAALEENRSELVRSQWELSHALVERHVGPRLDLLPVRL
jgi:hypothetical protein